MLVTLLNLYSASILPLLHLRNTAVNQLSYYFSWKLV